MEWFKLSSKLPRDPKWKLLPPRVKVAYIEWACEIAEQETDGLYYTKHTREGIALVEAGLAEEVLDGYYLPAFLKRNSSRAEMDAKRNAGRKGAAARWDSEPHANRIAIPNTEVEVEVEVERDSDKSAKGNTGAALAAALLDNDSRAQHFLRTLVGEDPGWMAVTNGALMKLGQTYDADVVTTALGFMREEFPTAIGSPYAYLESVCVRIQTERGAA